METLYHVENDDSVVGPVKRDEAHNKEILHRAGMVFVIRHDTKILLTRRSSSKDTFPDRYDSSCAFHVTFGESYEEAANRELLEEVGLHGTLEYLEKFSFHEPPENEMVAIFRCLSNEQVILDRKESTGANFFSRTEVDKVVSSKQVTPWLREGWKLVRNRI